MLEKGNVNARFKLFEFGELRFDFSVLNIFQAIRVNEHPSTVFNKSKR